MWRKEATEADKDDTTTAVKSARGDKGKHASQTQRAYVVQDARYNSANEQDVDDEVLAMVHDRV